jgi:ribosomal protein S19
LVTCSEFGGVALLLNHFVNLMIETHSGSKQAPVELVDPFVGNTSGK